MMRLQLSLNHDVDICLLHIQGPAVGTVQFIYLSQTYGVAVVPVVPVVFTRARSRAVSAVGSVRRPVAGNQCPTGGIVQFLHISRTFSADAAPARCSNSSKMLQCLLPQPLSRLKLSRWKGSVHRSITDRQCCYCSNTCCSNCCLCQGQSVNYIRRWNSSVSKETSSIATRSLPQISVTATAPASVDSRRLPVVLKLQHLLQCLSSTIAPASATMLAVDTRVTVQAYLYWFNANHAQVLQLFVHMLQSLLSLSRSRLQPPAVSAAGAA